MFHIHSSTTLKTNICNIRKIIAFVVLHSCSNGGLKPVALCRNKGQHVADQVVEDVQVLLLVVAYDGQVIPSVDNKAGEAAAARVLELEHVVLPRQLQRRALEVQRQPGHVVGPRLPRRREAEL